MVSRKYENERLTVNKRMKNILFPLAYELGSLLGRAIDEDVGEELRAMLAKDDPMRFNDHFSEFDSVSGHKYLRSVDLRSYGYMRTLNFSFDMDRFSKYEYSVERTDLFMRVRGLLMDITNYAWFLRRHGNYTNWGLYLPMYTENYDRSGMTTCPFTHLYVCDENTNRTYDTRVRNECCAMFKREFLRGFRACLGYIDLRYGFLEPEVDYEHSLFAYPAVRVSMSGDNPMIDMEFKGSKIEVVRGGFIDSHLNVELSF